MWACGHVDKWTCGHVDMWLGGLQFDKKLKSSELCSKNRATMRRWRAFDYRFVTPFPSRQEHLPRGHAWAGMETAALRQNTLRPLHPFCTPRCRRCVAPVFRSSSHSRSRPFCCFSPYLPAIGPLRGLVRGTRSPRQPSRAVTVRLRPRFPAPRTLRCTQASRTRSRAPSRRTCSIRPRLPSEGYIAVAAGPVIRRGQRALRPPPS